MSFDFKTTCLSFFFCTIKLFLSMAILFKGNLYLLINRLRFMPLSTVITLPFNLIFILFLFSMYYKYFVQNNIIIINGPNINLLGDRDKSVYGNENYEELINRCKSEAVKKKINIDFYQSNVEGELVTKIQESRNTQDGMIINAAAFTHTSVAIRDALSLFKKPCIELHISNIYKREEFRHKSLISDVVTGIICGLGTSGYILAINSIYEMIQNGNK